MVYDMRKITLFLWALIFGVPAAAEPVEVDLEIALMVDVSRSMSERELEIQRRGYAEALRTDIVFQAIRSGLLQRIAVAYVEWAGSQQVIVDWRLIETRDDLEDFAQILTTKFDPSLRRTSISGALRYGAELIETNDFQGLRKVIDVSGDGPNNAGGLVTNARDETVAKGIVINGLPLMTTDGRGSYWHLDGLDIYYQTCVIGGPGAFVLPVLKWDDFGTAVRRKLVMEIAGLSAPMIAVPAQVSHRDPTDCEIGEKLRRQRELDREDF
jgi:hypothetical protein